MYLLDLKIYKSLIKFLLTFSEYISLRTIKERRDSHDLVITDITDLIQCLNDTEEKKYIDDIFTENLDTIELTQLQDKYKIITSREKYNYFNKMVNSSDNFETIISWYSGIINLHEDGPDLNDNSLLKSFLYLRIAINMQENLGNCPEINKYFKISEDFICWLYCILIAIHLDDWNLTEAYNLLNEFYDKKLDESKLILTKDDFFSIHINLTSRLSTFGYKKEAEFCLSKTINYKNKFITNQQYRYYPIKGLNYDIKTCEEILSGKSKYRIVLKHNRQVENIKKLKIINEKDLKKYEKKGNHLEYEESKRVSILMNYISKKGFIDNLKYDDLDTNELVYLESLKNEIRIRKAKYICHKYPELEESKITPSICVDSPVNYIYDIYSQRGRIYAEYQITFFGNTNLLKVIKFTEHRITSILRSIVLFDQLDILDRALEEINMLININNFRSSFDLNRWLLVIKFLERINNNSNRKNSLEIIDLLKSIGQFYEMPYAETDLLELSLDELKCKDNAFGENYERRSILRPNSYNMLDASIIIRTLGYSNGLTSYGREHLNEIELMLNKFLENYKSQHGINYLSDFINQFSCIEKLSDQDFDIVQKYITKESFDFHIADDASETWLNYGYLPMLLQETVRSYLRIKMREMENSLREKNGIPEIGEGWLSESQLYNTIKNRFPNEEVIFHARPEWLKPQHIDVYLPEKKIALEYQGEQHRIPVEFFGGEESFVTQQERDKRKKLLCEQNNVKLIEVFEDTEIDLLISELEKLLIIQ